MKKLKFPSPLKFWSHKLFWLVRFQKSVQRDKFHRQPIMFCYPWYSLQKTSRKVHYHLKIQFFKNFGQLYLLIFFQKLKKISNKFNLMGMKITVSDIISVRKEVTVVYFFLNLNTASGKTSQFNSPTTRCMQRLLFCALKNSRFSSRLRKLLSRLTLINLFNWK